MDDKPPDDPAPATDGARREDMSAAEIAKALEARIDAPYDQMTWTALSQAIDARLNREDMSAAEIAKALEARIDAPYDQMTWTALSQAIDARLNPMERSKPRSPQQNPSPASERLERLKRLDLPLEPKPAERRSLPASPDGFALTDLLPAPLKPKHAERRNEALKEVAGELDRYVENRRNYDRMFAEQARLGA
jgi:hypothetical protein